MEFCIIAPAAGLEKYASRSRTHLVLPHINNKKYMNFYRKRREEGDLIILDNGAYEGKCDNQTLLQAMKYYDPQVTVLPDIPLGDAQVTLDMAKGFLCTHRSAFPNMQWMFVPSGRAGRPDEWELCLSNSVFDKSLCTCSWIGLARVMGTHIFDTPLARIEQARRIRKHNPKLVVHALGMLAGETGELWALKQAGVFSIDSSAPVWRGWNGYSLDQNHYEKKWPDPSVDFDAELPEPGAIEHQYINANLEEVLRWR